MAAMTSPVQSSSQNNRRQRVRHKIQTPAYASFPTESEQEVMLDLHEIVDISEEGVAIQCHLPLEAKQPINLCLDLAGCGEHIYTTGHVVWSNDSGRAGVRLTELPPASLVRLRDWLFMNAMAGVANADATAVARSSVALHVPQASYTDSLAAVTAIKRQVEALGDDIAAALQLIAARTQTLLRASGAALALADSTPDFMICRAASGPTAPPVGARLQVGSGFSGECVKTGKLLRCDDADTDARVDHESCRALGIRSILAVPVRAGERTIGILETFSPNASFFNATDASLLQRLGETVLAAVNRTARAKDLPTPGAPAPVPFQPSPGSVLFASKPEEKSAKKVEADAKRDDKKETGGISLSRSYLILLVLAAIAIALGLGYRTEPWIQSKLKEREQIRLQTVLASTQAPKGSAIAVESASFAELQQMAQQGNATAENALGLRYFEGDKKNGVPRDEKEAFRWFNKSAQDGNLAAQAKLGFLYSTGSGIPKDLNQAYFWAVLARAHGDESSKALATVLASGMRRRQAVAIEQQADLWLHDHQPPGKPNAAR
jgi:hypothetical protein